MTSSPVVEESFGSTTNGAGNLISSPGEASELDRTVRILERLARTLGVPVERFFETAAPLPADDTSVADVAELTRAFLAIRDPHMRRHCLDIVKAAGTESVPPRVGLTTASW